MGGINMLVTVKFRLNRTWDGYEGIEKELFLYDMININQSCNRECKDCKVYNICSLRHIIPLKQEQLNNNLNYEIN